jgi:hypothetical protein
MSRFPEERNNVVEWYDPVVVFIVAGAFTMLALLIIWIAG